MICGHLHTPRGWNATLRCVLPSGHLGDHDLELPDVSRFRAAVTSIVERMSHVEGGSTPDYELWTELAELCGVKP